MLHEMVTWLVSTVGSMGYPGIIFLMFLESSFFPFPSEVVIPPAGYLAHQGEMHLSLVILAGIAGSLLGALFNYWLSITVGRSFFERYGRYFLVSRSSLDKAEVFFDRHGHISTFVGRLIPGVRQYISLPAGVARMPLLPFCVFTAIGAGIWVVILALVGYWLGSQGDLVLKYVNKISLALISICSVTVIIYVIAVRRGNSDKNRS
ncbi:DedA family protein [Dethiosulfovibrio sp. F2B]|uniref:DedA family protein n=1 Tax=Dethiosulfovibrio faecalis TaxID=2720018 RepID=UPI001F3A9BD5|nr:DedA family protein [Dethiosulfovibrio faecalis]MCF4151446.1 DedA family protein [Dethiosulfovibrio faecalis]